MGLQLCGPTSHSSFPTGWKAEGGDSSPEQYGPRLCQFLCVSLAQGERERGLVSFLVIHAQSSFIWFTIWLLDVFLFFCCCCSLGL